MCMSRSTSGDEGAGDGGSLALSAVGETGCPGHEPIRLAGCTKARRHHGPEGLSGDLAEDPRQRPTLAAVTQTLSEPGRAH
jgi:hypothetical protein